MKPKQYAQGDVLIVAVESLPSGLEPIKDKTIILAEGEATGHFHGIKDSETRGFVDPNDGVWIDVQGLLAEVQHQEHGTITLPKGKYKIVLQREYSPEEIRRVAD